MIISINNVRNNSSVISTRSNLTIKDNLATISILVYSEHPLFSCSFLFPRVLFLMKKVTQD